MYEPLRRVIPGDEPPPAVALAEVPLIEVPLVAPACGDPVAAWVW